MPKSLSAPIVVDFYPATAVGCKACFKVRVMSQNSAQLLVSKKCDLAVSKASDLTSIEYLYASSMASSAGPLRLSPALRKRFRSPLSRGIARTPHRTERSVW